MSENKDIKIQALETEVGQLMNEKIMLRQQVILLQQMLTDAQNTEEDGE